MSLNNNFLDEYTVVNESDSFSEDELCFLDLSGRKAFWSKGYMGEGEVVAVIDTGVSPHPEFEDRLLDGYNTNRSYGTSFRIGPTGWYDDRGHGTHVAGSIAGKNVGIMPKAKILPIKVLDGLGGARYREDIVMGVTKAIDYEGPNGEKVSIINMSLSTTKDSWGGQYEELKKEIQRAVDNNILVVVSAGNTGEREYDRYPACFDTVVTVGAVDHIKKISDFSSYGHQLDLCQIGVKVISANYRGGYITYSGTSMSTPIVAGIAAGLREKYRKTLDTDIVPEYKLYELLKFHTKEVDGMSGTDKYYGVGFCTLQPLDLKLEIQFNKNKAKLNGEEYILEEDSFYFHGGRNYMSIRRLAELLGMSIKYDAQTETAILEA